MPRDSHPSQGLPGRVAGWLRAHWRGITAGLLASGGTTAGVIAGLSSTHQRLLWLISAGACAGLAVLLSLLPGHHSIRRELPRPAAVQTGVDVHISSVSMTQPTSINPPQDTRRWTIPPPVRSFTGRRELLLTIREQLTRDGATALIPTTALYGMGGVGKTQLALAYADHYHHYYELGWWIPADSDLSITTALAELAVALGMPAELPPRELADRTREVLAGRFGWLLLFDNAGDPTETAQFLPGAGGGHVLITSRSPAWQGIADPLQVDVLPLDEASELLRKRSGVNDVQAAEALAVELGQLPLALEQAAAYTGQHLTAYQRPLARYLTLFRERHAELLAKGRPLAYSGTIDTTFTLALDRLRDTNVAAVSFLETCALLAPNEIPVYLLLSQPEYLSGSTADAAHDPLKKDEMVSILFQTGLLSPGPSGIARTHRLVQIITLAHLSESDRQQSIEKAVELLAALFPGEEWEWEPNRQRRCAQLLPHAQAVLDHAAAERLTTPALAQLLMSVGRYLWGSELALQDARNLHQQALPIILRLYQGDHPTIARSLGYLASDLRLLGELDQARELDTQALEMHRRLYHGDHRAVARSLGALASDLRRLGEVDQARELDTQALEMRRRLYHGDHPDLARSLYGLAMDLRALGEVDQARELDTQALEMRRRLYHHDHPAIAYSVANLAVDVHLLGNFDEAVKLNLQALAMNQRLHEGDHPHIAIILNNLAKDFYVLGKASEAHDLDSKALAIRQRLYHDDHPTIAESLSNLAVDMSALRQAGQTRELNARPMNKLPHGGDDSERVFASRGLTDVVLFVLPNGRRARVIDD
jgi:tetratricopeptide (TPR) repeat protein